MIPPVSPPTVSIVAHIPCELNHLLYLRRFGLQPLYEHLDVPVAAEVTFALPLLLHAST